LIHITCVDSIGQSYIDEKFNIIPKAVEYMSTFNS